MMRFNPERVRQNARQATTEDLLDRVTTERSGMEPEALVLIEAELRARGVTAEQIERHADERSQSALLRPNATVRQCSFCHRPAVAEGWGWHRLWGVLPVFPRYSYYCTVHRPAEPTRP
jgi:hypothetical protein